MSNFHSLISSANKLKLKNDYYSALKLYEQALSLNKKNIDLMYEIGSIHRSLGDDLKKARQFFFKIIKEEPANTNLQNVEGTLFDYKFENDHLNIMSKLFNSKKLNDVELIDLEFALGKAYEDKEDYELSFRHFKSANDKKYEMTGSNIENLDKHFSQIIETFQKIDFNMTPSKIVDDKKLIFICGMQRSGTTLVEQIISKHHEVYGANELNILLNAIRNNFLTDFKLDQSKILENIRIKNIIHDAYKEMISNFKISEKYVTDKANENFKWIGIIKLFLPNSIIIHCEIALNELQFGKKINKICNLKWDDNCLKFYENNKTYIKTTSAVQARMPILLKSIGNYSNFRVCKIYLIK